MESRREEMLKILMRSRLQRQYQAEFEERLAMPQRSAEYEHEHPDHSPLRPGNTREEQVPLMDQLYPLHPDSSHSLMMQQQQQQQYQQGQQGQQAQREVSMSVEEIERMSLSQQLREMESTYQEKMLKIAQLQELQQLTSSSLLRSAVVSRMALPSRHPPPSSSFPHRDTRPRLSDPVTVPGQSDLLSSVSASSSAGPEYSYRQLLDLRCNNSNDDNPHVAARARARARARTLFSDSQQKFQHGANNTVQDDDIDSSQATSSRGAITTPKNQNINGNSSTLMTKPSSISDAAGETKLNHTPEVHCEVTPREVSISSSRSMRPSPTPTYTSATNSTTLTSTTTDADQELKSKAGALSILADAALSVKPPSASARITNDESPPPSPPSSYPPPSAAASLHFSSLNNPSVSSASNRQAVAAATVAAASAVRLASRNSTDPSSSIPHSNLPSYEMEYRRGSSHPAPSHLLPTSNTRTNNSNYRDYNPSSSINQYLQELQDENFRRELCAREERVMRRTRQLLEQQQQLPTGASTVSTASTPRIQQQTLVDEQTATAAAQSQSSQQQPTTAQLTSSSIFPKKLHAMLNDMSHEKLTHIASWQPHGKCFRINNPDLFTTHIMHRYFNQSKFTSFTRQLNLYGFKRLYQHGPDKGCYYHPFFVRDDPSLCMNIERTKVNGRGKRSKSNRDEEPNFLDEYLQIKELKQRT